MSRIALRLLALGLCLGAVACFVTSGANVATSSAPDPTSGRLGQINQELQEIAEKRAALIKERKIVEAQRSEAIIESGKITRTGPRPPRYGEMDETVETPGTLFIMHNQTIHVCSQELKRIDSELNTLDQKEQQIRNERAELERKSKAPPKAEAEPGPGGCFTPDTPIATAAGRRPIAVLAPGEEVLVQDEATGALDFRPVVDVFRYRETHYYLLNGSIRATARHRFMTDSGWKRVAELAPGMRLQTDCGWRILESKRLVRAAVEVFNLEVEEHHNFFVEADGERFLVHNTGGGGK